MNDSTIANVPYDLAQLTACYLLICLAWNTISCQTDKGNRVIQVQFSQDIPVWRMFESLAKAY